MCRHSLVEFQAVRTGITGGSSRPPCVAWISRWSEPLRLDHRGLLHSQPCRSVTNSIAGLNLSRVEAGIVVVAVRKAAVFTQKVVDAMEKIRGYGLAS